MTDLTFSMPDGREEKTNKQTNRQTKFSWIFLEEARWFSRAISYVPNEHHGLVLKCEIIMKENDGWYLSLTCWTPLDATFSVCLADFFNLLGTASSSSVETTSKYNSSAIIFKFYLRQNGLMVSVLNPGWLCFLRQVNT